MESFIKRMMKPHSYQAHHAYQQWRTSYHRPEMVRQFCCLIVSQDTDVNVRQYALLLLKQRLSDINDWLYIQVGQRDEIKSATLTCLSTEQSPELRRATALLMGQLIELECQISNTWIIYIIKFIMDNISCFDADKSKMAAMMFRYLSSVVPHRFVLFMNNISEMYFAELCFRGRAIMAQPTLLDIYVGLAHLVPASVGYDTAEKFYYKILDEVVKSLRAYAELGDEDAFCEIFSLLNSLAEHYSEIIKHFADKMMVFLLDVDSVAQKKMRIRTEMIKFIGTMATINAYALMRTTSLSDILLVLLNMLAAPEWSVDPYDDSDESQFSQHVVVNVLRTMSESLPPSKLIQHLKYFIWQPFEGGDNDWSRRAALLSLGAVAKGCSQVICDYNLKSMIRVIQIGIYASERFVRVAAYFAFAEFSEHMQPQICRHGQKMLATITHYLEELFGELFYAHRDYNNIMPRMFYAFECYCVSLKENFAPYMADYMRDIFQLLDKKIHVSVRRLSIKAICAIVVAVKGRIELYTQQIIEAISPYLQDLDNDETLHLRGDSIVCLASLASAIGGEQFNAYFEVSLPFATKMFQLENGSDARSALYALVGTLPYFSNLDLMKKMPIILQGLLKTFGDAILKMLGSQTANANNRVTVREIGCALKLVKDITERSGCITYILIEDFYGSVYNMLLFRDFTIRRLSIMTLTAFLLRLHARKIKITKLHLEGLVPRLAQIIRDDESAVVVISALEAIKRILIEMQKEALPTYEYRHNVYLSLRAVMEGKTNSKLDESGSMVVQEILEHFGNAMFANQFASYYNVFHNMIKQNMHNFNMEQRTSIYKMIHGCLQPLGQYVLNYFVDFSAALIIGLSSKCANARYFAACTLGELITVCKRDIVYAFPVLLTDSMSAMERETHPGVMDRLCGALARIIIIDPKSDAFYEVLTKLLENLPIRIESDEIRVVMKCFETLIDQANDLLSYDLVEAFLKVCMHSCQCTPDPDDLTRIEKVILLIRIKHPKVFKEFANTDKSDDAEHSSRETSPPLM